MNAAGNDREKAERYGEELFHFIADSDYPCIGAKAAMAKQHLPCFVGTDIRCPHDDASIATFLFEFVDRFRSERPSAFYSAAVIFDQPQEISEEDFDTFLWNRLQAIADIDATFFPYDARVSGDPAATDFSFSIKAEALYVIGLHPHSARKARRFLHPGIVFNPHQQFDWLRSTGKYDSMKRSVRRRDLEYSGSVNPMLADFGVSSEAIQYSGKQYGNNWKCPFASKHQGNDHHSSQKWSGVLAKEG
ncbi:MAG TPA: guanitoxin biosynthesis heme-dependent pre-guanitoxin N-hydroxylase GntA [Chryseolinea sp.]|nr:guanitoxin biosynthesis heme-dependent pre-guanitoxin N-hydroxylase GntA [Chryseolinea sp.]